MSATAPTAIAAISHDGGPLSAVGVTGSSTISGGLGGGVTGTTTAGGSLAGGSVGWSSLGGSVGSAEPPSPQTVPMRRCSATSATGSGSPPFSSATGNVASATGANWSVHPAAVSTVSATAPVIVIVTSAGLPSVPHGITSTSNEPSPPTDTWAAWIPPPSGADISSRPFSTGNGSPFASTTMPVRTGASAANTGTPAMDRTVTAKATAMK